MCVYHQYVILSKKEKKIIKLFTKKKIQFGKHYPQPIHQLKCSKKKTFKNQTYPNAENFSKKWDKSSNRSKFKKKRFKKNL